MSLLATPLDFEFRGYSIWLELEQHSNDLDLALSAAAQDLDVECIPAPHVTALYGINHLTETQVLRRFRERLMPRVVSWPELRVKGFKVDKSYDGIDEQEMDMAWMEVEFETSDAHEELVDAVYEAFHDGVRVRPWEPHVSIAYENPDIAKVNLDFAISFMERYPSLTSQTIRRVKAMSVWRTEGKMEDWKCVDRYELVEASAEVNPAR